MAIQLANRGPNPDLLDAEAGPQQSLSILNIFPLIAENFIITATE